MPATVIDSLVVKLGLDPSGYKKGSQEANKQLKQTKSDVEKAAEGMGKAITSAARQFALAFLGFQSASGLVKMVGVLNNTARQLGFLAANTGTSAAELKNWSNAAENAGGSATDFLNFIQQIQKVQQDLLTNGGMESTGFLKIANFLQVGLRDANGKMKGELAVFMQLADALQKQANLHGRPFANSLGLQMGIDQNTLNAMANPAKFRRMLADQRSGFQLDKGTTDAADRFGSTISRLKQQGQDFGYMLIKILDPKITEWGQRLSKWLGSIDLDKLASRIDGLIEALAWLGDSVAKLVDFLTGQNAKGSTKEERAAYEAKDKIYKGDPALNKLGEIAGGGGWSNIVSGKNRTGGDIVDSLGLTNENDMVKYLDLIERATGKKQDEKLSVGDYSKIVTAVREEIRRRAASGKISALGANPDALNAVRGAGTSARMASNTGGSTSVTIGKIEVHTAATDANGIAKDIRGALARNQLISQANTGLS